MTVLGANSERYDVAIPGSPASSGTNTVLSLRWGIATDIGHKRAHNEDSLVAIPPVFAVADGMGGHAAGDVASDAVVKRLAELAPAGPGAHHPEFTTPEEVLEALRLATTDITSTVDAPEVGAGTTVTGAALTLHEGTVYWTMFNVGDSRLYLFERNVLTQVSVDHSVVQEMVTAGLITAADAEHHPDSNIITRAVGFSADPAPDFWIVPVEPGTRLLLCSDGLSREIDDRRIRLHLAAKLSPAHTAQALVDAALASGGRDNVTAVVIDVMDGGAPPPLQDRSAG